MESTPSAKVQSKLVLCLLTGWLLYFAFLLILTPPFWSRMDDAANLTKVTKLWTGQDFFSVVLSETKNEIHGIGMMRPVYPACTFLFYNAFKSHPALGYLGLILAILSLFWWGAVLFERSVFPDLKPLPRYLFFVMCLCYTPHFNLFFNASILEKFVLFSGLASFSLAYGFLENGHWRFNSWPVAYRVLFLTTTILMAMAIGFLGKANTIFLIGPLVVWMIREAFEGHPKEALPIALLLLLAGLAAGYFSLQIRGEYTYRYQITSFSDFLSRIDRRTILYLGIALLGLLMSIGNNYRSSQNWRKAVLNPFVVWPVALICFLIVMVPWPGGSSAYYITPAGIFIVGTATYVLLSIIMYLKNPVLKNGIVAAVFLLSVSSARILASRVKTLHAQREVAEWIHGKMIAGDDNKPFIMMPTPCEEAALSLSYFSRIPNGVKYATGDMLPEGAKGQDVYLITLRDCPLRPIKDFEGDNVVFEKGEWKIYADIRSGR